MPNAFGIEHHSEVSKKRLTTKERNALPDSSFADPKNRRFPMNDKAHAKNALARANQGFAGKKLKGKIERREEKMVHKGASEDAAKLLKDGLKFKPITPKKMTGPGSMRHIMDPTTSHRADAAKREVGKSAASTIVRAHKVRGAYRITDAKKARNADRRFAAKVGVGAAGVTGAVGEGERRAYNRMGANVRPGEQYRHPVRTARTYRAIDRSDVTKRDGVNAFGIVHKSAATDVTTGLRRGLAGGAGQFGGKGAKVLNASQAVGRSANKTGQYVATNKTPVVAGAVAGGAVTTTATAAAKKPQAQGPGW